MSSSMEASEMSLDDNMPQLRHQSALQSNSTGGTVPLYLSLYLSLSLSLYLSSSLSLSLSLSLSISLSLYISLSLSLSISLSLSLSPSLSISLLYAMSLMCPPTFRFTCMCHSCQRNQ